MSKNFSVTKIVMEKQTSSATPTAATRSGGLERKATRSAVEPPRRDLPSPTHSLLVLGDIHKIHPDPLLPFPLLDPIYTIQFTRPPFLRPLFHDPSPPLKWTSYLEAPLLVCLALSSSSYTSVTLSERASMHARNAQLLSLPGPSRAHSHCTLACVSG